MLSDTKYLDQFVSENGFICRFDTSAKENIGIDEAANALVEKVAYFLS